MDHRTALAEKNLEVQEAPVLEVDLRVLGHGAARYVLGPWITWRHTHQVGGGQLLHSHGQYRSYTEVVEGKSSLTQPFACNAWMVFLKLCRQSLCNRLSTWIQWPSECDIPQI